MPTPHFPDFSADEIIGRFVAGHMMSVSRQRREWPKNQAPTLERLEGIEDVWMLCFRKPPPGWRLLGRFLCKDVFVGLVLIEKKDLFGKYEEFSGKVIAEWEDLFEVQPVKSDEISENLGHVWIDKDAEDEQ